MANEIQQEVKEFTAQNNIECDLPYRILDMVSELGEVAKEFLKNTNYGAQKTTNKELSEEWEKEIGDIFFTLICIANESEVDLNRCLSKSLTKYKRRLEQKDTISSE